MSENSAVILDDYSEQIIGVQLRSGRYQSPADVVRASLQLLEAHDEQTKALEFELAKGENSGVSDLMPDDIINKFLTKRRSASFV